jgi:murein DD-endopeptidase MepM/ murein hydrolase activator NlpD
MTKPIVLSRISAAATTVLVGMLAASDVGEASHGTFTVSAGIYRIPYANGSSVSANNDHHNHPNVPNRVDLGSAAGSAIVAAASGTIRGIVDFNGDDFGLGDGLGSDGVTPQDDSLEHSCLDDSTVVGQCSDYNNYVWIQHGNGEWTKYTHLQTGTVTAQGWAVGDVILVGQVIGLQGDVGSASGPHLHHEVAVPTDPTNLAPFSTLGGFVPGAWNVVANVCFTDGDDNGDNLYTDGESYTSGPCPNTAPTANAGGPYIVNEGSAVVLDGTGSSDPHNAILSYSWSPATNLTNPSSATPTYNAIDDAVDNITLTVSDVGGDVTPGLALTDSDVAVVTVLNVAPTVVAAGDNINEAGTATVSATFTDPGTLDTHTAAIDWGDGTAAQAVTVLQLAAGVTHVYGDNGVYNVVVTVTDDDGGAGSDAVNVTVANLNPQAMLHTDGAVSFPGGDYFVVEAGAALPAAAHGTDAGSDDLTFTWSVGDVHTYFNNGVSPDPLPSPAGVFPFMVHDMINAVYAAPGVQTLHLTLTDDDGGSDHAEGGVIVTGTADDTQGLGWWKHQYSGNGSPHIDAATAAGYLAIVNAVSSVFSEDTNAATAADVHAILSPTGGDRRQRAKAELMVAWLQFASGAVSWNATVPLKGSSTVGFLDLMFAAENTILDATATKSQLQDVEQALARVRHAGSP